MIRVKLLMAIVAIIATVLVGACNKNTSATDTTAANETTALPAPLTVGNTQYVEGVAGGAMIARVDLEAEVVSVDQEKREAVLRGPEGNEVVVRVGKEAVNFYQVSAGDRVNVTMIQELVIYVAGEEQQTPDGVIAGAAAAEEGAPPAGVVVASSKVTGTITALDADARTSTLSFEDGTEKTFDVRPDVEMENYSVGQEVVFLLTELLALSVSTL